MSSHTHVHIPDSGCPRMRMTHSGYGNIINKYVLKKLDFGEYPTINLDLELDDIGI